MMRGGAPAPSPTPHAGTLYCPNPAAKFLEALKSNMEMPRPGVTLDDFPFFPLPPANSSVYTDVVITIHPLGPTSARLEVWNPKQQAYPVLLLWISLLIRPGTPPNRFAVRVSSRLLRTEASRILVGAALSSAAVHPLFAAYNHLVVRLPSDSATGSGSDKDFETYWLEKQPPRFAPPVQPAPIWRPNSAPSLWKAEQQWAPEGSFAGTGTPAPVDPRYLSGSAAGVTNPHFASASPLTAPVQPFHGVSGVRPAGVYPYVGAAAVEREQAPVRERSILQYIDEVARVSSGAQAYGGGGRSALELASFLRAANGDRPAGAEGTHYPTYASLPQPGLHVPARPAHGAVAPVDTAGVPQRTELDLDGHLRDIQETFEGVPEAWVTGRSGLRKRQAASRVPPAASPEGLPTVRILDAGSPRAWTPCFPAEGELAASPPLPPSSAQASHAGLTHGPSLKPRQGRGCSALSPGENAGRGRHAEYAATSADDGRGAAGEGRPPGGDDVCSVADAAVPESRSSPPRCKRESKGAQPGGRATYGDEQPRTPASSSDFSFGKRRGFNDGAHDFSSLEDGSKDAKDDDEWTSFERARLRWLRRRKGEEDDDDDDSMFDDDDEKLDAVTLPSPFFLDHLQRMQEKEERLRSRIQALNAAVPTDHRRRAFDQLFGKWKKSAKPTLSNAVDDLVDQLLYTIPAGTRLAGKASKARRLRTTKASDDDEDEGGVRGRLRFFEDLSEKLEAKQRKERDRERRKQKVYPNSKEVKSALGQDLLSRRRKKLQDESDGGLARSSVAGSADDTLGGSGPAGGDTKTARSPSLARPPSQVIFAAPLVTPSPRAEAAGGDATKMGLSPALDLSSLNREAAKAQDKHMFFPDARKLVAVRFSTSPERLASAAELAPSAPAEPPAIGGSPQPFAPTAGLVSSAATTPRPSMFASTRSCLAPSTFMAAARESSAGAGSLTAQGYQAAHRLLDRFNSATSSVGAADSLQASGPSNSVKLFDEPRVGAAFPGDTEEESARAWEGSDGDLGSRDVSARGHRQDSASIHSRMDSGRTARHHPLVTISPPTTSHSSHCRLSLSSSTSASSASSAKSSSRAKSTSSRGFAGRGTRCVKRAFETPPLCSLPSSSVSPSSSDSRKFYSPGALLNPLPIVPYADSTPLSTSSLLSFLPDIPPASPAERRSCERAAASLSRAEDRDEEVDAWDTLSSRAEDPGFQMPSRFAVRSTVAGNSLMSMATRRVSGNAPRSSCSLSSRRRGLRLFQPSAIHLQCPPSLPSSPSSSRERVSSLASLPSLPPEPLPEPGDRAPSRDASVMSPRRFRGCARSPSLTSAASVAYATLPSPSSPRFSVSLSARLTRQTYSKFRSSSSSPCLSARERSSAWLRARSLPGFSSCLFSSDLIVSHFASSSLLHATCAGRRSRRRTLSVSRGAGTGDSQVDGDQPPSKRAFSAVLEPVATHGAEPPAKKDLAASGTSAGGAKAQPKQASGRAKSPAGAQVKPPGAAQESQTQSPQKKAAPASASGKAQDGAQPTSAAKQAAKPVSAQKQEVTKVATSRKPSAAPPGSPERPTGSAAKTGGPAGKAKAAAGEELQFLETSSSGFLSRLFSSMAILDGDEQYEPVRQRAARPQGSPDASQPPATRPDAGAECGEPTGASKAGEKAADSGDPLVASKASPARRPSPNKAKEPAKGQAKKPPGPPPPTGKRPTPEKAPAEARAESRNPSPQRDKAGKVQGLDAVKNLRAAQPLKQGGEGRADGGQDAKGAHPANKPSDRPIADAKQPIAEQRRRQLEEMRQQRDAEIERRKMAARQKKLPPKKKPPPAKKGRPPLTSPQKPVSSAETQLGVADVAAASSSRGKHDSKPSREPSVKKSTTTTAGSLPSRSASRLTSPRRSLTSKSSAAKRNFSSQNRLSSSPVCTSVRGGESSASRAKSVFAGEPGTSPQAPSKAATPPPASTSSEPSASLTAPPAPVISPTSTTQSTAPVPPPPAPKPSPPPADTTPKSPQKKAGPKPCDLPPKGLVNTLHRRNVFLSADDAVSSCLFGISGFLTEMTLRPKEAAELFKGVEGEQKRREMKEKTKMLVEALESVADDVGLRYYEKLDELKNAAADLAEALGQHESSREEKEDDGAAQSDKETTARGYRRSADARRGHSAEKRSKGDGKTMEATVHRGRVPMPAEKRKELADFCELQTADLTIEQMSERADAALARCVTVILTESLRATRRACLIVGDNSNLHEKLPSVPTRMAPRAPEEVEDTVTSAVVQWSVLRKRIEKETKQLEEEGFSDASTEPTTRRSSRYRSQTSSSSKKKKKGHALLCEISDALKSPSASERRRAFRTLEKMLRHCLEKGKREFCSFGDDYMGPSPFERDVAMYRAIERNNILRQLREICLSGKIKSEAWDDDVSSSEEDEDPSEISCRRGPHADLDGHTLSVTTEEGGGRVVSVKKGIFENDVPVDDKLRGDVCVTMDGNKKVVSVRKGANDVSLSSLAAASSAYPPAAGSARGRGRNSQGRSARFQEDRHDNKRAGILKHSQAPYHPPLGELLKQPVVPTNSNVYQIAAHAAEIVTPPRSDAGAPLSPSDQLPQSRDNPMRRGAQPQAAEFDLEDSLRNADVGERSRVAESQSQKASTPVSGCARFDDESTGTVMPETRAPAHWKEEEGSAATHANKASSLHMQPRSRQPSVFSDVSGVSGLSEHRLPTQLRLDLLDEKKRLKREQKALQKRASESTSPELQRRSPSRSRSAVQPPSNTLSDPNKVQNTHKGRRTSGLWFQYTDEKRQGFKFAREDASKASEFLLLNLPPGQHGASAQASHLRLTTSRLRSRTSPSRAPGGASRGAGGGQAGRGKPRSHSASKYGPQRGPTVVDERRIVNLKIIDPLEFKPPPKNKKLADTDWAKYGRPAPRIAREQREQLKPQVTADEDLDAFDWALDKIYRVVVGGHPDDEKQEQKEGDEASPENAQPGDLAPQISVTAASPAGSNSGDSPPLPKSPKALQEQKLLASAGETAFGKFGRPAVPRRTPRAAAEPAFPTRQATLKLVSSKPLDLSKVHNRHKQAPVPRLSPEELKELELDGLDDDGSPPSATPLLKKAGPQTKGGLRPSPIAPPGVCLPSPRAERAMIHDLKQGIKRGEEAFLVVGRAADPRVLDKAKREGRHIDEVTAVVRIQSMWRKRREKSQKQASDAAGAVQKKQVKYSDEKNLKQTREEVKAKVCSTVKSAEEKVEEQKDKDDYVRVPIQVLHQLREEISSAEASACPQLYEIPGYPGVKGNFEGLWHIWMAQRQRDLQHEATMIDSVLEKSDTSYTLPRAALPQLDISGSSVACAAAPALWEPLPTEDLMTHRYEACPGAPPGVGVEDPMAHMHGPSAYRVTLMKNDAAARGAAACYPGASGYGNPQLAYDVVRIPDTECFDEINEQRRNSLLESGSGMTAYPVLAVPLSEVSKDKLGKTGVTQDNTFVLFPYGEDATQCGFQKRAFYADEMHRSFDTFWDQMKANDVFCNRS
ncbi:hypothetical protein BESB_072470 [Besnoitia besnoiti]|uniref:Uncharacterized protein n=1 Tax=Besnoitia besnoiti TaxID=94643 RepID=A0A2A9M7X0_BESBE|nr:uncharacterized protein BESB_072470 [Besnoitia besnoiti]PFH34095.1 hypothetical protein BESB_072470 [Besnoitia besnoiti]